MKDTVFEFTPWGCHSILLTKKECPKIYRTASRLGIIPKNINLNEWGEIDLSTIVTISGAALDGQKEKLDIAGRASEFSKLFSKSWTDIGLDLSHMNMGYHLSNPSAPSWQRIFHKILPWPLYLISDWGFEKSSSIYLSDGGHSDNLGLLPLIRRGVKKIIVVDAEEDENSIFEAAKRINYAMKNEKFGLKLEFKQTKPINVFKTSDTPFKAYVCLEMIQDCSKEFISEIFYIKLSVPGRHNHIAHDDGKANLPFTTRKYMEENPRFPHQSTADVFYDPEQFKAYRDLGYFIAKKLNPAELK